MSRMRIPAPPSKSSDVWGARHQRPKPATPVAAPGMASSRPSGPARIPSYDFSWLDDRRRRHDQEDGGPGTAGPSRAAGGAPACAASQLAATQPRQPSAPPAVPAPSPNFSWIAPSAPSAANEPPQRVAPSGAAAPSYDFSWLDDVASRRADPATVTLATKDSEQRMLPVLARMERLFGTDFDDVTVHPRSSEASGSSPALAHDRQVHFAGGAFQPGSIRGDHVFAHELAHLVQLRGVGRSATRAELEAEADRAAWRVTHGLPSSVALRAPAGTVYAYSDRAGNTIPDPIDVTWSGDAFRIEFRRDDSASSPKLVCVLRYLGPHAIDGPGVHDPKSRTIELARDIGPEPLHAMLVRQTTTSVEIDLYGDGTQIIRVADEASLEIAGRRGRKHMLGMAVNRARGSYATLWVRDSSARPGDIAAAQIEDRPGMPPRASYEPTDSAWTLRLDGDGDQYKELEIKLKPLSQRAQSQSAAAQRIQVQFTQLSSHTMVERLLELPAPAAPAVQALSEASPAGGELSPVVTQVSDGGRPTIIELGGRPRMLVIHPPERTRSGITYHVQGPGLDTQLPFPASSPHTVFGPGTAAVIGDIVHVDLTLGAYRDPFRLTLQPRSANRAVLGLSQLYRGQPTGGLGVEVQLTGPIHFQQLRTDAASLGLDLDGDRKPDLVLHDHLTAPGASEGGGPPENHRNHQVRIIGTAAFGEKTFTFRIRDGVPIHDGSSVGDDHAAVANALAVGELTRQQAAGTRFDDHLDAYEAMMIAARKQAVPALLSQATFDAWRDLSQSLIQLRAQKPPVSTELQKRAAGQADTFYQLLSGETSSQVITKAYPRGISESTNPYTGTTQAFGRTTGPGVQLSAQIRAGAWPTVFSSYQRLVAGLDQWIIDRAGAARTGDGPQLALLAGRRRELAALDGVGARPVLAVFQPDDKFQHEPGFVRQLPLALYYWKSGSTWHLRNLTNPDRPYHVTADVGTDETASLRELFSKLDDPDRMPAGRILYDIPGSLAGEVRTTDHLTWQKALSYLGLALAAAGATLATLGTGSVAVAGAWVMASASLAGGIAAGIDLADKHQHGDLDAAGAVLDIAQMVSALAGASALASGRIALVASNATVNARWAGNWARLAALANKIYLPATRVAAAADALSLGVITEEMARQLDAIESRRGDDPAARARAKLRLLIQFAALGTMTSLTIKGALPSWSRTRTLVLHPGPDGVPVATLALDASSTIIDSQIAIALEKQAKGLPLQSGEQAMVAKARSFGDLRVTDTTAAEAAVKTGDLSRKGVPTAVGRTNQAYQDVIAELGTTPPIGGSKGHGDREVVADALFAVTEPGVTPTLAVHDKGVYNPLAKRAGIDPAKLGAPLPERLGAPGGLEVVINGQKVTLHNSFEVTIQGRKLRVVPVK